MKISNCSCGYKPTLKTSKDTDGEIFLAIIACENCRKEVYALSRNDGGQIESMIGKNPVDVATELWNEKVRESEI